MVEIIKKIKSLPVLLKSIRASQEKIKNLGNGKGRIQ